MPNPQLSSARGGTPTVLCVYNSCAQRLHYAAVGFLIAPLYWNACCFAAFGFLIVPQMEPDTRVLGSKVKREDWTFEQDMVFEHAMAEFDETVSKACFCGGLRLGLYLVFVGTRPF